MSKYGLEAALLHTGRDGDASEKAVNAYIPPHYIIDSEDVLPNPGHGWKAMNKVYNVTSEATGLPSNNTDIM